MIDAIIDALLDTLKTLPFLFAAFLLLEFIEHKLSQKSLSAVKKAGRFGPLIGAALGAVPQCGFSAMTAEFYATRVVSVGTVIAVLISTSDEMLPIMLSHPGALKDGLSIIAVKIVIAVIAGYLADLFTKRKMGGESEKIHDLCESEHCCCEGGIFRSALRHTVRITVFLLIVTLVLNIALFFLGEEALGRIMLKDSLFAPVIASLVGLIPNCAVSVALSELYLSGAISFGSCLGGLICSGGVGLLVLFRTNRPMKHNFFILLAVFLIGAAAGVLTDLIGIAL